jgi:hypothetical protein
MDNQKIIELIDLIYKSLQFKLNSGQFWIKPESDTSSYKTYDFDKKLETHHDGECQKYEFLIDRTSDNKAMIFNFKIRITKIKRTSGFWKKVDSSRYITHIKILSQPSTYSNGSELESYFLDTDKILSSRYPDTTKIQSQIFNLLESEYNRKKSLKDNEKIDGFINEIKKSVDQSLVRDEKINNILD